MNATDPVFPHMVRVARTLVGWNQKELARRANVSEPMLSRFERGETRGQARNLEKIRRAFADAHVSFEATPGRLGVWVDGITVRHIREKWEQGN